jgi:uncharacterized membrane-anchored protein
MSKNIEFIKPLLFIASILCLVPKVSAYLDPGSGSYIIQMVIAGFLGGLYAVKLYWYRIVGFFKRSPRVDENNSAGQKDE